VANLFDFGSKQYENSETKCTQKMSEKISSFKTKQKGVSEWLERYVIRINSGGWRGALFDYSDNGLLGIPANSGSFDPELIIRIIPGIMLSGWLQ
jgi:hypothetical protein